MAFRVSRRSYRADDQISHAQVMPPQLRLRNIHILRTDRVVVAQESHAFRGDLKDAAANFEPFLFGFSPPDIDDQVFFFQPFCIGDFEFLRNFAQ